MAPERDRPSGAVALLLRGGMILYNPTEERVRQACGWEQIGRWKPLSW